MRWSSFICVATISTLAGQVEAAIDLDLTSTTSIKKAASTIAYDLMTYYTGNHTGDTPGNLPDPYYWWEAGAMFVPPCTISPSFANVRRTGSAQ